MKNTFSRIPANKRLEGLFLMVMKDNLPYPLISGSCLINDADGKTKLFARLAELEKQGVAAHIEDEKGDRLS